MLFFYSKYETALLENNTIEFIYILKLYRAIYRVYVVKHTVVHGSIDSDCTYMKHLLQTQLSMNTPYFK